MSIVFGACGRRIGVTRADESPNTERVIYSILALLRLNMCVCSAGAKCDSCTSTSVSRVHILFVRCCNGNQRNVHVCFILQHQCMALRDFFVRYSHRVEIEISNSLRSPRSIRAYPVRFEHAHPRL